jgi:hypothetical protein
MQYVFYFINHDIYSLFHLTPSDIGFTHVPHSLWYITVRHYDFAKITTSTGLPSFAAMLTFCT